MPVTLDDIRRERERRGAQEQARGITLQDVQAERSRRAADEAYDPFAPIGGTGDPQAVYRTNPTAEAVQEAFPTTLATPDVAGSTAGEIAGGALGTLAGPLAPVAVPALAAVGSGVGLAISRYLQDEPVTVQEVTGEAILSAIPEAVTQAGRGILRAAGASKRARFSDLAEQARREAGEVFDPPELDAVRDLFGQVAESGVKVDANAIRKHVADIGPQFDDLLQEVRRVDRGLKNAGEFEGLLSSLQGGNVAAYDIGRLQSLHSEIGKRLQSTNLPFEAKKLLGDFNYAIDDAIYNGLARGQNASKSEGTRNTLRLARAGWARIRRTEELSTIVEKAITSDKSGSGITISLGRIRDSIRKGVGKEGRSIRRGFEHDPQAKQRFYAFLDRLAPQHDSISVSLADLPPHTLGQVAGKLGDWMASIYTNTAGREAFENLVISGQGRFTHSTLANLANVARRELEREEEARSPSSAVPSLTP